MDANEKDKTKGILFILFFTGIFYLFIYSWSEYYKSKLDKNHLYTLGMLTQQVNKGKFHGWYYDYYYESIKYTGRIKNNSNRNDYPKKMYIIKFEKDNPQNEICIVECPIPKGSLQLGDTINRSLLHLD